MKIMAILQKIGWWFKGVFSNLLYRIRPRLTFRWIFSFVVWLLVIAYIGFGVYFGFKIYKYKSEDKATKFAVKIYPLPAATVNSSVIWAKDYYQQLNYIRQFSSKTKQSFPDEKTIRQQITEQLIENKLLENQARKYRIKVTSKDVDDAYKKIVDQSGGTSEVKKVLNELYGMTEKDFKVLVKQQVLKEKIQNEVIAQVKVAHILIKDEGRAKEIADRVKKGENFGDLAKQFSEDTKSRDAGGELGWLAKGQLVIDNNTIPEFDNAAFAAKKGEIVGPVKTNIGFEIILVEDKKGQVEESFNDWLNNLKKQAKIWRFIQ